MDLRGLLKRFRPEREAVEVPVEEEQPREKVSIRIENLTGLVDVDRFAQLLREGNILFLKSRELQRKDLGQLQLAVQKLKRLCTNYGYDIAGTEDGYLVMTPKFAQILR